MGAQNRFGEGQTRVYKTGQKYLCLSLDFLENRTWESIQYIYLGIFPGIRREGMEREKKEGEKQYQDTFSHCDSILLGLPLQFMKYLLKYGRLEYLPMDSFSHC